MKSWNHQQQFIIERFLCFFFIFVVVVGKLMMIWYLLQLSFFFFCGKYIVYGTLNIQQTQRWAEMSYAKRKNLFYFLYNKKQQESFLLDFRQKCLRIFCKREETTPHYYLIFNLNSFRFCYLLDCPLFPRCDFWFELNIHENVLMGKTDVEVE